MILEYTDIYQQHDKKYLNAYLGHLSICQCYIKMTLLKQVYS